MATDPFGIAGIGIKIQWTPGDINKQIQEIQSYIDTKKLNINFNIDKNALSGLDQITKQATSQAQVVKGAWTEVLTPLENLKNLKTINIDGNAAKVMGELHTATGETLQVTRQLFNVYSEDGRIIDQVWRESTQTITKYNEDAVIKLKNQYASFVEDFNVKILSMENMFSGFINTDNVGKLKTQLGSLQINEQLPNQLKLIGIALKDVEAQAEQAQMKFIGLDSIQAFQSKALFKLEDIQNVDQLSEKVTILKDKLNSLNNNNFTKVFKEEISQNISSLKEEDNQITKTIESVKNLELYTESMKTKLANLQVGKSAVFSQSGIQSEMTKFLDDLSKVGTVGSKSTQELNLQFAQLGTSVRSAASDMSLINREADNFGTTLVKDFGKMMAWSAVATAMYTPLRALTQGIKDVISLNDNLTQTATAMNTTVSQLGAITTGAQQMSQAMGASVKDVLQIMHVYANVNETASSIIQKTKADVILSNLTGMNGQETTNVLQGVQQQFNLADDQLMHVDDALTKIASNLRVNYQTAIKEIGEGVKTAGTMAEQSGLTK